MCIESIKTITNTTLSIYYDELFNHDISSIHFQVPKLRVKWGFFSRYLSRINTGLGLVSRSPQVT